MSIHEDKELCAYLLDSVKAKVPLQILPSKISGSGLFTTQGIAAGEEIFVSKPLVNCIHKEFDSSVCDYCFTSHISGFSKAGDEMPDIKLCRGCRASGYCSKVCQTNAWKGYHKFECKILKIYPPMDSKIRALRRLLCQHENGLLSPQQWKAVNMLKSHDKEHLASEKSGKITRVSLLAAECTKTSIGFGDVRALYCILLTNCISTYGAKGVTTGDYLDIVASLMNHSCDPNAFVFHEGDQLRVRSLKFIRADEEITQCYANVDINVFFRQAELRENYIFTCKCSRCEEELATHRAWAGGDMSRVHVLQKTFKQLNDQVIKANASGVNDLDKVDSLIIRMKQAFPQGDWQERLQLLPLLSMQMATLCRSHHNYLEAFRCGLRGCLYSRCPGPKWVGRFDELLQHATALIMQPMQGPLFKDNEFVTGREFWDVYCGYLRESLIAATKIFGEDTALAKSLQRRWNAALEGAPEPRPGTAASLKQFKIAQLKLLAWAEIDDSKGLTLSKW